MRVRLEAAKVPPLQLVGCTAPAKQKVPSAQTSHWALAAMPETLLYEPSGHGSAVEQSVPAKPGSQKHLERWQMPRPEQGGSPSHGSVSAQSAPE